MSEADNGGDGDDYVKSTTDDSKHSDVLYLSRLEIRMNGIETFQVPRRFLNVLASTKLFESPHVGI